MTNEIMQDEKRLNVNVQHIYAALRSAMVDRDRDTDYEWENHVIVEVADVQFALKNEIPSGAMLISYMMLFYPGFLDTSMRNNDWVAEGDRFLGGEANKNMPLFANEVMVGIAMAVGVYAGFIQTMIHPVLNKVVLRANTGHPMVQETHRLMLENSLTILDARDVFIDLMQIEEFRIPHVADDYIANTSWIIEHGVAVDSTLSQYEESITVSGNDEA